MHSAVHLPSRDQRKKIAAWDIRGVYKCLVGKPSESAMQEIDGESDIWTTISHWPTCNHCALLDFPLSEHHFLMQLPSLPCIWMQQVSQKSLPTYTLTHPPIYHTTFYKTASSRFLSAHLRHGTSALAPYQRSHHPQAPLAHSHLKSLQPNYWLGCDWKSLVHADMC